MNDLEHLTEEDILYDPRSDTYKVKVWGRTVEVPDYPLRSERLNMLKDALKDTLHYTDGAFSAFRRDYLGDWAEAAEAKTATEAEEAARAGVIPMKTVNVPLDVYTHGQDVFLADAQGHKYAIIGDGIMAPVKDQDADADIGSQVGNRGSATDKYPSIPHRALIKDAIELLNKNKKLRLSKVSLNRFGSDYILIVSSRGHTALGKTPVRTMEVSINLAAFNRALKTELDRDAGLKASLDTNTYIKLRIAFLLYKALSMNDDDAKKFCAAGIFRVMSSTTQFDYSA